jgi:chromosome segregation ATPase
MAEDGVTREIEEALNKIVNTTDQSGNMRKELKKTIFETVSTLRNLFVTLNVQLKEGKSEKARLESELKDTKTILDECRKTSNNADTETSGDL